jgi:ketosteroid isomerase-like protein
MNQPKTPLRVFLCHASVDTDATQQLYDYLERQGIHPWFDQENLLPGEVWKNAILRELETSDAIIVCLSRSSVKKEGFVQKEIRLAVDRAMEVPDGSILLLPVMFEKCDVPRVLQTFQWVDLTEKNGYSKLISALARRATQLGRKTVKLPELPATKEGLPGRLSSPDAEAGGIPATQQIKTPPSHDEKQIRAQPPPAPELTPRKKHKKEIGREVWAAIIIGLATILASLIGSLVDRPRPTPTSAPTFTQAATPVPTDRVVSLLPPTMPAAAISCPIEGKTDHDTIVSLIQAEAAAVNQKDFELIKDIFDPAAVFFDRAEPEREWRSPRARYEQDLFLTTTVTGAEHFDIQRAEPGIVGDTAYYTSGSRGIVQNNEGTVEPYNNPSSPSGPPGQYGSDHWTLRKNSQGCWLIVRFEFNAAHMKFP